MTAVASQAGAAGGALTVDDPGTGTFTGYASLFGVTDLTGDVMLKGAFAASLARRGTVGVKLLYQHDPGQPIGRWLSLDEDDRGLKVVGRIHGGIERGREVLSLMRAGILDGLSIGFRTVRARRADRDGLRRVAEVDLWEISVVTFPMLPGARIAAVGTTKGVRDAAALARRLDRATRLLRKP